MIPSPSFRRGFTLVELLAALAVVGLLAALLVPALNKALLTARMTHTMSNMRQIAAATTAYAGDNDGRLPGPFSVAVYIYARKYPAPNDIPHLGNYVGQYLDAPDLPTIPAVQCIVPVLKCPLLSAAAQSTTSVANYVTWDYPYNNPNCRFGGGNTGPLVYISVAQALPYQPAHLAGVTTIARNSPFLSTADKQVWASSQGGALPATGAYQGKRLWLFLDGTVQINSNTAIWTR